MRKWSATALVPKSALYKVVSGRENLEPGCVPPSSTFGPLRRAWCADLIWGHCSLDDPPPSLGPWRTASGGWDGQTRLALPSSGRVPSHAACAQPVPSRRCPNSMDIVAATLFGSVVTSRQEADSHTETRRAALSPANCAGRCLDNSALITPSHPASCCRGKPPHLPSTFFYIWPSALGTNGQHSHTSSSLAPVSVSSSDFSLSTVSPGLPTPNSRRQRQRRHDGLPFANQKPLRRKDHRPIAISRSPG